MSRYQPRIPTDSALGVCQMNYTLEPKQMSQMVGKEIAPPLLSSLYKEPVVIVRVRTDKPKQRTWDTSNNA